MRMEVAAHRLGSGYAPHSERKGAFCRQIVIEVSVRMLDRAHVDSVALFLCNSWYE
jgi:hypothetical protein